MYRYEFDQLFSHEDFPIQLMRASQGEQDFHQHDFHEVVLIIGGCGFHETQSGKSPICDGDVLVIPKGKSHRYCGIEKLRVFNFIIDPDRYALPIMDSMMLPSFKMLIGKESSEMHFHVSSNAIRKLKKLAFELYDELKTRKVGYQFASTSIFMHIMLMMARESPQMDNRVLESVRNDVYKLVDFMGKNLAQKISMKNLARKIHVSDPTLFRHFRNYLGTTPNNYLLQLRVSKAAELLVKTELSLGEISFKTGFYDSSHFARVFTKLFGINPSRYRKQAENDNCRKSS